MGFNVSSQSFTFRNKITNQLQKDLARWWFQHIFYVHPDPWGNVIQFDMRIFFSNGLVQPPTSLMFTRMKFTSLVLSQFKGIP